MTHFSRDALYLCHATRSRESTEHYEMRISAPSCTAEVHVTERRHLLLLAGAGLSTKLALGLSWWLVAVVEESLCETLRF